ncbi:hypothetical protein HZS_3805 [Henneguya salminicola]|nr:hypothetical protein HZS_3805 [Henneguya salminicola]
MYLIQELIPQTAVDIAFKCNILHEETENLLIVKGNILEIYDIKTNKNGNINLIIRHIEEFYSNIIAISSFKFIDGKECLILCFHNIKISIIQYDNIDKKMKLCYIYDMDIEINVHIYKISLDRIFKSSCFLLFNDNISLFSFKESQSNSSSFDLINEQINRYSLNLSQTELKIHKIIDATFMTNYGNDTVGILYEPLSTHINLLSSRSDTLKFTAIIIDRDADILIPIWTINNLPFDSFKLLPICPSLGGIGVIAINHLIYINQGLSPYVITINEGTKLTNLHSSKLLSQSDQNITCKSESIDFNENDISCDHIDELFSIGSPLSTSFGYSNDKKSLEICHIGHLGKIGKIHRMNKFITFTEISSLQIPSSEKLWIVNYTNTSENHRTCFLIISLAHSTMLRIFTTSSQFSLTLEQILDEIDLEFNVQHSSYCFPYLFLLDDLFNVHIYTREMPDSIRSLKKIYTLENIVHYSIVCVDSFGERNEIASNKTLLFFTKHDGCLYFLVLPDINVLFCLDNFYILPSFLLQVQNIASKSTNQLELLSIKEIFLAHLGESSLNLFLFVRCENFCVVYQANFYDNILQFTRRPFLILSTNTDVIETYSLFSNFHIKHLVPFSNNSLSNGFISLDSNSNINILCIDDTFKLYKGWVHRITMLDFLPNIIDFHPQFDTYFIAGETYSQSLTSNFENSYLYTYQVSDNSVDLIHTFENQQITCMRILKVNCCPSDNLLLVISCNQTKTDGDYTCVGTLNVIQLAKELDITVKFAHSLEFAGGISCFEALNGKLAISSFNNIYIMEYTSESNSFVNIGSIQTGPFTTSMTALKDLLIVGDISSGVQLLHYQNTHKYISLVSKKNINKVITCVNFIINHTKTDVIAFALDGSVVTLTYCPEISKTKNGTELLMTTGIKLPGMVVSMLNILDSHMIFDKNITLSFLVQSGGALSVLVPLSEKMFRRQILLISRLNDLLPDCAGLNFTQERLFYSIKAEENFVTLTSLILTLNKYLILFYIENFCH